MEQVIAMMRRALEVVVMDTHDEATLDQAQLNLAAMCAHLSALPDGRVQRLVGLGLVVSVLETIMAGPNVPVEAKD